jgi:hypothetical protein
LDPRFQYTSVVGASWDPKTQEIVSQKAGPAELQLQGDLDSRKLASVLGSPEVRLQTSAPVDGVGLKAWAGARQMKSGLARVRGHMAFEGSPKAVVGELMEVRGVGRRFEGDVFIGGVTHRLEGGAWITEVTFGVDPFWFAERKDVVSPMASGWTPGIGGLQVGVVKKLDANPDGEPMIQVTIPVLGEEAEGVWARLGTFYGSKDVGSFFIPEVEDEVVLGFLNDDPSAPVVLGSLQGSARRPPEALTAENHIKALVTRSKLRVGFDDEKKVIAISTPAGNQIELSDDGKSVTLTDESRNSVSMTPDGITLNSAKDIEITAKGKILLHGSAGVSAQADADVKVSGANISHEAKAGFTAKGGSSAELSAAGVTTIKGSLVRIN